MRYDAAAAPGGTRFTRTVRNLNRPKPPTEEMIQRMDEEAETALAAIKRNVEARAGV